MQKRRICAIAALMWMLLCAWAQAATYTYERDNEVLMTVENFDETLPESAARVFAPILDADDEILCGTIFIEAGELDDLQLRGQGILSVRRAGEILLMGAYRTGSDTWDTAIETDAFFADGQPFSIYTQVQGSHASDMQMLMACEDGTFALWTQEGGVIIVHRFAAADGGVLEYQRGQIYHREGANAGEDVRGVIPNRLAAWTYETFPRTMEAAKAFAAAHPLVLADDEGFIGGVNLRERATDQSPTWGKYTARVRILGSRPGRIASWVYVQIGSMTGWVSGMYLETANNPGIYDSASRMQRAGRVLRGTSLMDEAGQEERMALEEGTLVHVLGGKDGWLHVIVPRSGMTWQTDWDGTYGLVRTEDVATGVSAADARWK